MILALAFKLFWAAKKVFTYLAARCMDIANYVVASWGVHTVPPRIWFAFECSAALARIGVFLASLIFSWTIAAAPYFTIALSIFSMIDQSFAPHASSIVMIQLFLPLSRSTSCLQTISVRIVLAALIAFLAATIPCVVVTVLIIESGSWIASATVTVLVAIRQCGLRFFAAAKPGPSIELDDKVELYPMHATS